MAEPTEQPQSVAVFQFEIFDRISRSWSLVRFHATQEYIDRVGGVALPHTRICVAAGELEVTGIHRPALKEAGPEPA